MMPHLSKLKGCSHASNHRSRSEAAGRPSGVGSPVGVLLPHRGPHNAWTYFRGQPRIQPSIGTVGDAYDNSLMESIIGLFKTEAIRTEVFHEGPLPEAVRCGIRYCRVGRLVEQPTPPQQYRPSDPDRVRTAPLRRLGSGAQPHMKAAENLGRFRTMHERGCPLLGHR